MMQFVVLGLIPGTSLQITYNWYGVVLGIILLALGKHYIKQHSHKHQVRLQTQLTAISLSSLDRA